jgi:hypothetical protein
MVSDADSTLDLLRLWKRLPPQDRRVLLRFAKLLLEPRLPPNLACLLRRQPDTRGPDRLDTSWGVTPAHPPTAPRARRVATVAKRYSSSKRVPATQSISLKAGGYGERKLPDTSSPNDPAAHVKPSPTVISNPPLMEEASPLAVLPLLPLTEALSSLAVLLSPR